MKTWAREHCYYIMKEALSTITQTRSLKNWYVMLSIQGLSGQYIQNNFSFTFHNSKYWYCFAQWATSDVQLYSLMITGSISNFQPRIWTQ